MLFALAFEDSCAEEFSVESRASEDEAAFCLMRLTSCIHSAKGEPDDITEYVWYNAMIDYSSVTVALFVVEFEEIGVFENEFYGWAGCRRV